MTFYVVRNTYHDGPELAEARPAHRAYLATLVGSEGLRAAGPLPEESQRGGLIIVQSDSRERVVELMAADPLWVQGLVADQTITVWDPIIGDTFV